MSTSRTTEPSAKGEVPALVEHYLDGVLPNAGAAPREVRIEQTGQMWQKPGARPLRFTAVQRIAVEEVAFAWRARFPIVPLVSLHVLDRYAAGAGLLEACIFGLLPVMRQQGQETNEGEAMRYLAELPWAPHAMQRNRQLEWRQLDAANVEVATRVGAKRVAVQLEFDRAGDIAGAFAEARPHPEGKTSVPRPWGGLFADYELVGGIRIPTRAEVRWELPSGPFTYFSGRVISLELVAAERN